MEFTELADYHLPSGRVTEWTPSTEGDGECWAVDDRPLTYVHEHHVVRGLAYETRDVDESSWLGGVFEVHERYDERALARTLRSWMLRHEALRTTVATGVDTTGAISMTRLTNAGCVLDMRPRVTGPIDASAIHDHLTGLFDSRISALRWPHCLVASITEVEGALPGDGFVLVFAADHSVMDAYSMLLSINEIQRLYAFELRGAEHQLPQIGSHIDFSVTDRLAGGCLTADHVAVRAWDRFLGVGTGAFPAFPLPVEAVSAPHVTDCDIVARPQTGTSSWLLSNETAAVVNAHCRRLGFTLQSAVLAALATTTRELTGLNTLRFTMPVHTRHESQYAESVGWYVGIIPVEIDITRAQSFADCMSAAAAAIAERKDLSRYPYPRVAELLENRAVPRFVVSYLDVRFVPGAHDWVRWRAHTLRSAAYSGDEVYLWISRTPEGLNISARYPATDVATTNVSAFISGVGDQLAELTQEHRFHASTPAPFSLTYSEDKFPA